MLGVGAKKAEKIYSPCNKMSVRRDVGQSQGPISSHCGSHVPL
jgi:hypothetical protein